MTALHTQACDWQHKPPSSLCLHIHTLEFFSPYMRNPRWLHHFGSSIPERRKTDHSQQLQKWRSEKGAKKNTFDGSTLPNLGKKILTERFWTYQGNLTLAAEILVTFNSRYVLHQLGPDHAKGESPRCLYLADVHLAALWDDLSISAPDRPVVLHHPPR